MLCCSANCPKYEDCGRAIINQRYANDAKTFPDFQTVEHLYSYGSGFFGIDKDGKYIGKCESLCGPSANYNLFYPRENYIMPNYTDMTAPIKITSIEDTRIIEEEEEEEEMNDNISVEVKINPYKYKDSKVSITLDFDHPVHIRSVNNYDELVEIEHDGHIFIVSESELSKAISRCSHTRW